MDGIAYFTNVLGYVSKIAIAAGAAVAVAGGMSLSEGFSNDNPGAKSQGYKQLISGGGIILLGLYAIPSLSGFFTAV